ncbi:MAG: NUDIX domain-containing protein [Candidatus Nomurabacteria bacterium]|nr:MAG: NUDIX domain-containing protein [Candidatus Nomurabacteria bacterium]
MKNIFPKGVEVVAGVIIFHKGKILIARSPKWSDKWTLPGGHIDPGETIAEAAMREAEEETGLKVHPLGFVKAGELIYSKDFHRPAHFLYFDYAVEADDGNATLDKRELTEMQWCSPKEALQMDLAESFSESIQAFLEKFPQYAG